MNLGSHHIGMYIQKDIKQMQKKKEKFLQII